MQTTIDQYFYTKRKKKEEIEHNFSNKKKKKKRSCHKCSFFLFGSRNFQKQKTFIKSLIKKLDVDKNQQQVRVGMVSFNQKVRRHFALGDYNNKHDAQRKYSSLFWLF